MTLWLSCRSGQRAAELSISNPIHDAHTPIENANDSMTLTPRSQAIFGTETPAENAPGLTDEQTATSENAAHHSAIPTPAGNEEISTAENAAYHSVMPTARLQGANASEEISTRENVAYHSVMYTTRLQGGVVDRTEETARVQNTLTKLQIRIPYAERNVSIGKPNQYMDSHDDSDYEN